jgi:hypothetical protein
MNAIFEQERALPASAAEQASRRYVAVLLAACAIVLGLILWLNLALGERALGSVEINRLASEWQQASKGVTYGPPTTNTRPFKILRLADRLPELNGLVLGASSVMGVTEAMFPPSLRVYNMSVAGNSTASVVAEAEYVDRHQSDRIRWMLIGLDWSVGMMFHPIRMSPVDLSPAAALSQASIAEVPLHRKLADALSLPRVVNLGKALKAVLVSPEPLSSFRHTFFDVASAEYRCPDGVPARDFDVANRGICLGFRYDGSWTFAGESHLTAARASMLTRAAAAPSSKFSRFLCESGGRPGEEYLQRLAALIPRYAAKGGRLVFLMPPVVPGMEQEMLSRPETRACLTRAKAVLGEWARKNKVTIIDAGASERFGCEVSEFLDENHAFPECLSRVFATYWRDEAAGRVGPGLYRPQ